VGYDERKFCVLCAWRELCTKKYSYSDGLALNCPDFVRDLTLKSAEEDESASAQGKVE
jgi:hypothetical protein